MHYFKPLIFGVICYATTISNVLHLEACSELIFFFLDECLTSRYSEVVLEKSKGIKPVPMSFNIIKIFFFLKPKCYVICNIKTQDLPR